MTYPTFLAGMVPTPDELNAIASTIVIKSANQSVTSSTTLIDDNDLAAAVEADATYEFEVCLRVTGNGGDIDVAWTGPSGASMSLRLCMGPDSGTADVTNTNVVRIHRNIGTEQVYGTTTSNSAIVERGILVTSSNAGTLQLQWAQNSSNINATTVGSGSFLKLRRIA